MKAWVPDIQKMSCRETLGLKSLIYKMLQLEEGARWWKITKSAKIGISKAPAPMQPIMVMYTALNHLVYEVNVFSLLAFAFIHFDDVHFLIN